MRARLGPRVDTTTNRPTIGEQQFQLGGAAVNVDQLGRLRVAGTSENDRINLEKIKGGVRLTVNGESRDLMGKLNGARILGEAGDDRITIGPGLNFPVVARGGAGDDVVKRPKRGLDDIVDQFAGTAQRSEANPTPREPALPGATNGTEAAPLDYDALLNDE